MCSAAKLDAPSFRGNKKIVWAPRDVMQGYERESSRQGNWPAETERSSRTGRSDRSVVAIDGGQMIELGFKRTVWISLEGARDHEAAADDTRDL